LAPRMHFTSVLAPITLVMENIKWRRISHVVHARLSKPSSCCRPSGWEVSFLFLASLIDSSPQGFGRTESRPVGLGRLDGRSRRLRPSAWRFRPGNGPPYATRQRGRGGRPREACRLVFHFWQVPVGQGNCYPDRVAHFHLTIFRSRTQIEYITGTMSNVTAVAAVNPPICA